MSFSIKISPKDRATGRFMSRVHRALIKAIMMAKEERGMSQVQIADAMGVDKSFITRILNGEGNLTLKTMGDISWAVGLRPEISFHSVVSESKSFANHHALKAEIMASTNRSGVESVNSVEIPYGGPAVVRPSGSGSVFRTEVSELIHGN